MTSLLIFGPHHSSSLESGTSLTPQTNCLNELYQQLASSILLCHCFSQADIRWYRNFNRLSIAYSFRSRLRSRLTLRGRTFLRNPWAFDGEDSHFALATNTGILSRIPSTTLLSMASASIRCSSTQLEVRCQMSEVGFISMFLLAYESVFLISHISLEALDDHFCLDNLNSCNYLCKHLGLYNS